MIAHLIERARNGERVCLAVLRPETARHRFAEMRSLYDDFKWLASQWRGIHPSGGMVTICAVDNGVDQFAGLNFSKVETEDDVGADARLRLKARERTPPC